MSIQLEKEMSEQGLTRYTFEGARLQNAGHAERVLPKPGLHLMKMPERIRKTIEAMKKMDGVVLTPEAEKKMNDAMENMAWVVKDLEEQMRTKYSGYAVAFVRNKTAG